MDVDDTQWDMPLCADTTADLSWMSEFAAIDYVDNNWFGSGPAPLGIEDMDAIEACTGATEEESSRRTLSTPPTPDVLRNMSTRFETAQRQDVSDVRQQQQQQHSLPRRRSKYLLRQSGCQTRPVAIPTYNSRHEEQQSLVMQRWQDSPPQDESASLSAIYRALEGPLDNASPRNIRTQHADTFHAYRRPPSITSLDSGASSSSLQSDRSSQSVGSGQSRSRSARHPSKRGKTKAPQTETNTAVRIFKCTFCCDTFKHKYDWSRHEKSLHLSIEEWQCAPHGGSVIIMSTGRSHCAYCSTLDPTTDHLEQHNHNACRGDLQTPRAFRRKDHLVQHLRLFHSVDTLPLIDDWKVEPFPVLSRCGFCNMSLNSWNERTNHLAAHFHKGKTMADWRGDHGFDAAVAARVTCSLEPYLIADDSKSQIPFSATDPASKDHYKQISSQIDRTAFAPAAIPGQIKDLSPHTGPLSLQQEVDTITFVNVLSHHLGRFAREQISMGVIPTDEMFQRESRRVMYSDEEDSWNQTLADNREWIEAFRKRNGWKMQAE